MSTPVSKNTCRICARHFSTRAALKAHLRSRRHQQAVFVRRHRKHRIPVTPAECALLLDRGIRKVIFGPEIVTRQGGPKQRQKTRHNPWVLRTEVRRVLSLTPSLEALLKRSFTP